MAQATRLTREGRLTEAVAAIQHALRSAPTAEHDDGTVDAARDTAAADRADDRGALARHPADIEDIPFRELPADVEPSAASDRREPAEQPSAPADPAPGTFTSHRFAFGRHAYRYRLFVPGSPAADRPVLVLLHGCKQDSEDFARGTAMNELARTHGCIVVYPEQLRSANNMGCWNWFDPAHQRRGAGEPAMIAALASKVAAEHGGDPRRIYVAGLSAGGAMAALVARLYPEVFAAVGVHSGLPPAAAHDVASALRVMRNGSRKASAPAAYPPVPTIVFHGSADKTVHPSNAEQVVRESLDAWRQEGVTLDREQESIGGTERQAMRTRYVSRDGHVLLEKWDVAAGPHAWSGGEAGGSYTDPQGPSASRAMLEFFMAHRSRFA